MTLSKVVGDQRSGIKRSEHLNHLDTTSDIKYTPKDPLPKHVIKLSNKLTGFSTKKSHHPHRDSPEFPPKKTKNKHVFNPKARSVLHGRGDKSLGSCAEHHSDDLKGGRKRRDPYTPGVNLHKLGIKIHRKI